MGAGHRAGGGHAGHRVVLSDAATDALDRARAGSGGLAGARGGQGEARPATPRMPPRSASSTWRRAAGARGRHSPIAAWSSRRSLEDLTLKKTVFAALERVVAPDAVLAHQHVVALRGCDRRRLSHAGPRGRHPLLQSGAGDAAGRDRWRARRPMPRLRDAARAFIAGWGKTTVVAADTPGFIVNRVARPFYGESLRIAEEGIADFATIDWAMSEHRRVPDGAVRAHGLHRQRRELRRDLLGVRSHVLRRRATGRRSRSGGWSRPDSSGARRGAATTTTATARSGRRRVEDATLGRRIVDRVLAMLINEAVDALYLRVASRRGHRPRDDEGRELSQGPARLGRRTRRCAACCAGSRALQDEYGEDRYRPSPLLRAAGQGSAENPRVNAATPDEQARAESVVGGMLARDAFSQWLGVEILSVAPRSVHGCA